MSIRPVLETLSNLGAGALLDEAAEKLSKVVLAVDQNGKAGALTIKISLRKATAGALALSYDVVAKIPEGVKSETLLFATPEGNLLTKDPKQRELSLRAASEPENTTPITDLGSGAPERIATVQ